MRVSSMFDQRDESPASPPIRRIFLHAGHVWAAAEPTEITTILGSCVAICIWDPAAGVGGMNHYMLPHDIGTNHTNARYARFATTMLLEKLLAAGADRRRLRAKVFGGACVLQAFADASRDLGAANVRVARERLFDEHIPIVEEDTGGTSGRKLIYLTATGETRISKVSRVIP